MKHNIRSVLMASVAVGLILSATPVRADDSDQAAIKQLQAQIKVLQKQLNTIAKAQANTPAAPAKAASVAATPSVASPAGQVAVAGVVPPPPPAAIAAPSAAPAGSSLQNAIYNSTGAKITLGGYVEADGIYRTKNEAADVLTNFNTSIPFNNSVNSHQSEFRGSARASRVTLLAEANPDQSTKLVGYVEADFLGAASTSNSIETNSYVPRMRQGFIGYENSNWGWNVYAGQMWSLATLYKNGLAPRSEALPQTIDIALLPGYTYERGPELRLVKELDDNKLAIGLSAVSPQVNFGGITTPATVTSTATAQSSTLQGTPSSDIAPDLIAKIAYDPGYGHYEAFGIGRFFHDNVDATLHNNTVFAGGGGVGAVLPIIDKVLDLQGNALVGQGVGRYGPALLPDYAFSPTGAIKPLTEYMGSVGLVGRPAPTWVTYLYAGAEKVLRDNQSSSSYGYGDYSLNNSGCLVENGECAAQTSTVWQVTGGLWKDLYSGNYGTMKVGLQDSVTRRDAFSGVGGVAPHAYENTVLTAFRYSPF